MKNIYAIALFCWANIAFAQTPKDNSILKSLNAEKDSTSLKTKIGQFSNSLDVNEVSSVIQYYITQRKLSKADSLAMVAAKRFPQSRYAFKLALSNLKREADPKKQETSLQAIRTAFPDQADSPELDAANGAIALNYAKNRNTAKAMMHFASTKNKDSFLLPLVNILVTYDLKAAAELLTQHIVNLKKEADNYKLIYSKVLLKLGNPAEALVQAREVYEQSDSRSASEVTITYATALAANQKYKQALPLLEAAVSEGKSTNAVDSLFLKAYKLVAINKDSVENKNAEQYLDSLNQALAARKAKEIKGRMIDKTCPNFVVTDVNGKKISLADFKGKTIILDFWATWCGPCKASFPAMQMVVNRYKEDPDVKFLFINTFESSKNPQKGAVEFLKANNYDLPLYMDLKDMATNRNPCISLFDVQVIPTKFIVDGQGRIRFKLTGFESGMDRSHAAEVSAMIEMARNI